MSQITLHLPAPVAAPRGAQVAAELFSLLLQMLHRVLTWRPRTDLRLMRRAEAAELRRYAQTLVDREPGLAADLFAAADRHVIDD